MRQKSKKMALSKKNFFFLERGHLMARLRRLHKYQFLRMLPFLFIIMKKDSRKKRRNTKLYIETTINQPVRFYKGKSRSPIPCNQGLKKRAR